MVAAAYGSIDVLKFLVTLPYVDVNRRCGKDRLSALHCAALGGSVHSVAAVELLLSAGAFPNSVDAYDRRFVDVIVDPPMLPSARDNLEKLFTQYTTSINDNSSIPSSPDSYSSPHRSPHRNPDDLSPHRWPQYRPSDSSSESEISLLVQKSAPDRTQLSYDEIDSYTSDREDLETFKLENCPHPFSHDWIICPFVHEREDSRRRDPLALHYSCVRCPDFHRVGGCTRGDLCEYAYGIYESWLHPTLFRSKLCNDACQGGQRICGSASRDEQLRPPLYKYDYGPLLPSIPSGFKIEIPPHASSTEQPDVPTPHLRGSNFLSIPSTGSSSIWARRHNLPEDEDEGLQVHVSRRTSHNVKNRTSNSEQVIITRTTTANDLPQGWIKEIRTKKFGSKITTDTVWIDPGSG